MKNTVRSFLILAGFFASASASASMTVGYDKCDFITKAVVQSDPLPDRRYFRNEEDYQFAVRSTLERNAETAELVSHPVIQGFASEFLADGSRATVDDISLGQGGYKQDFVLESASGRVLRGTTDAEQAPNDAVRNYLKYLLVESALHSSGLFIDARAFAPGPVKITSAQPGATPSVLRGLSIARGAIQIGSSGRRLLRMTISGVFQRDGQYPSERPLLTYVCEHGAGGADGSIRW